MLINSGLFQSKEGCLTDTREPKSYPRLSPDGKTIAFTGAFNGVYTIPIAGGKANQKRKDSASGEALVKIRVLLMF